MTRQGRALPFLGVMITGLALIGPNSAQSQKEPSERGRDPGLHVTATVSSDTVCLGVEPAYEPLELRVFRDGQLRHSTPQTRQTCFIEDEVAEGTHHYDVEAVGSDGTVSSGSAEVRIERPEVRLLDLRLAGSHVEAGDELVIEGELQGVPARVELDASALDSGFQPGYEQVEIRREDLRITYPLSPNNVRSVGVYPVQVRIYDRQGNVAVRRTVDVTYLPLGRSRLSFPSGRFVAKALDSQPEPTPGLAIERVERVKASRTSRENLPRLFDDGFLPPAGDALRIVYSVPAPRRDPGATRLEIQDLNASGVFRIPAETPTGVGPECTDTCRYEVVVPFENDPSTAQDLRFKVVTYDAGWHNSGPSDKAWTLECDSDPGTPEPLCFDPKYMTLRGRITFRQRELVTSTTDFSHPNEPQYRWNAWSDATRPAAEILVKITDGCGGVTQTFTDDNGDFDKQVKTFCPDETMTVRAYSFGAPIQGRDVAVGVWTADDKPTPTALGDITRNSEDYTVVSGIVGSFVPDTDYVPGGLTLDKYFGRTETGPLFDAGKFSRSGEMARALGIIRSIRRAQDYQAELIDVAKLDRINVALTDVPLQGTDNTAFFRQGHPRLVYLPPRGEYSPFAAWHEMFHYFDEQTLGTLGSGAGQVGYGRWGEPLANTRAALLQGDSFMPTFQDLPAEDLDYNWNIVSGVPQAPPAVDPGDSWSQGWIWRVAWDLADGIGGEPMLFGGEDAYDLWDGWSGSQSDPNNSKLHRVIRSYFPQVGSFIVDPDYQDRGLSGPDLVDLLDGMVCQYAMSEEDTGVLLHDVMNYDYLYDHCQD